MGVKLGSNLSSDVRLEIASGTSVGALGGEARDSEELMGQKRCKWQHS